MKWNESPFADAINAASGQFKVPQDIIAAVIEHESSWDPNAIGDGGEAVGLMQVHRAAASQVGMNWTDLEKNPQSQIWAGTAYLAWLYKRFNDWTWTLAAYNQGPTVIGRAYRYSRAVNAIRYPPLPKGTPT